MICSKLNWKKVTSDHNIIVRTVYEPSANYEGYMKDKALCNPNDLKKYLQLETKKKKSDSINETYLKEFPNYSTEIYAFIPDID
jgi:hypothetical protein